MTLFVIAKMDSSRRSAPFSMTSAGNSPHPVALRRPSPCQEKDVSAKSRNRVRSSGTSFSMTSAVWFPVAHSTNDCHSER
jgi:hypothetical protein